MKVRELRIGTRSVHVRVRVLREVTKRTVMSPTGPVPMLEVLVADETGTIVFTVWGDNTQRIKVGDVLDVKGARVKAFRGQPRLTLGRTGTFEIIEDTEFPSLEQLTRMHRL